MKQYKLYQRYVASFGGSRFDQICEVRRMNSKGELELLSQESQRGSPTPESLSNLAIKVSQRYPFEEKDEVQTISKLDGGSVPGFIGIGIATGPFEKEDLDYFSRSLFDESKKLKGGEK
jgi:hypothetical protein